MNEIDLSKLRGSDIPLMERIDIASKSLTRGRGISLNIPPERTDVDIVLHDCRERIQELQAELAEVRAERDELAMDRDVRLE